MMAMTDKLAMLLEKEL
jgi:hypothetical protein